MSSPHFYQAEEKFVDAVFGMRPNKEQHQTTIDVNPVGKSKPPLASSAEVLPIPPGGQTCCSPLGGAVAQRSRPA